MRMWWSWAIWISIIVVVLGGGYYYVGKRLISTMSWSQSAKTWSWIGFAFFMIVIVLSMVLFRSIEIFGNVWAWITYIGLGFLSLVMTTLVLRDLIMLGAQAIGYLSSLWRSTPATPADPGRRGFLLEASNFAVLGVAGALTAYGMYEARRKPGIIELSIEIKKLPESFEGFRIVQITDIHAGLTVRRDWVETIVRQVEALNPDLIAFTGDLADGSVPDLKDDVAPLIELQAPHGKYFVTGNHEYYSGAEAWVEHVGKMGYDVLMNEHRTITRKGSSIVLAGVADYSAGGFVPQHASDPKKAIAGAPADAVKVLMAHQPRSLYAAETLGYDLMLSGHTHGGQFFPWNLAATIGQPFIKGLHNRNGTWIYVSKGTGYWGPPVRLGARSEITAFTLTKGIAASSS
jgi:predicted MPP superfamily phosphohydrolase